MELVIFDFMKILVYQYVVNFLFNIVMVLKIYYTNTVVAEPKINVTNKRAL
jgi:hypothetical protein